MSKIVHQFVDTDGKTHTDEFTSNLPLDMDSLPDEYRVFMFTARNSRLIADAWKACDDANNISSRVMLCAPAGETFYKFDDAKLRIRQLCFENLPTGIGGIRAMKKIDYNTAMVASAARDMDMSMQSQIKELENPDDMKKLLESATNALKEAFSDPKTLAAISAHKLHRRMAWIADYDYLITFNMLGRITDPTWFVNPVNPYSSGMFKSACGLYGLGSFNDEHAASDTVTLHHILSVPFRKLLTELGKIKPADLNHPRYFFQRYALRFMQHELDDGSDAATAVQRGIWLGSMKLINFIWLNWMELTHSGFPVFDPERFFFGDSPTIELAENAACS